MTEENQALEAAALEDLKDTATRLGVQFHPSIGHKALSQKVAEHRAKLEANQSAPVATPVAILSVRQAEEAAKRERIKKAQELVRIRIVCRNPAKKAWQGELFSAGNSEMASIKKFVPFNEIWHVPRIMLNVIKEREYQEFYNAKSSNGVTIRKGRLSKEFVVEELPMLTDVELKELAQRQAMASGTQAQL